jgi:endonuclease YncB( thermonuclease family)
LWGRDVSAELVRQGAARVYRRYSDDPGLLLLESQAQQGRRGLWGLLEAERMPLWEWRAADRHLR